LIAGVAFLNSRTEIGIAMFVDCGITLVLALLVKYKNSRAAATIYFILFLFGKVGQIVAGNANVIIIIISIVFAIVFYKGMIATYRLHNAMKETGMPVV